MVMKDALLFLNSEWQGCESKILEKGSIKLARKLFNNKSFVENNYNTEQNLSTTNGVFALDTIGNNFLNTLNILKEKSPERVFTIGGTCGTEAAPVSYLNDRYDGDIAVIWFDAHADLNSPDTSPSGHFHGMVLRTLLGNGPDVFCENIDRPIISRQVFLAGVRDMDKVEKQYIESSNVTICEIGNDLINQIATSGFSKIYVHIDVDVINPDHFSDSLMPTQGGPSCEQLSECLSELVKRFDIVGVGIVEYCGRQSKSANQISRILIEGGIINDSF